MSESAPRSHARPSSIRRVLIFVFGAIGVVSGILGIVQFFSDDRNADVRITTSIEDLRTDVHSVNTSQEAIRKETQSINSRLADLLRRYDALVESTTHRIERPLTDTHHALVSANAAVQQGHDLNATRMEELHGRISAIYPIDTQINGVEAERRQLASALAVLRSMDPGDQGAVLVTAIEARDRQLSDQIASLRAVRAQLQAAREQFTRYISENIGSTFSNNYMQ